MHCYPNYYKDFKCIASLCRHNCCIGWEIDIDKNSLAFYDSVTGEIGTRLKESIAYDDNPHFLLDKDERCPFLNKANLCDIICSLGKDHLCDICKEHPRFHNELPGRIESGIGLCCEEACRIILGQKEKMTILYDEEHYTDDKIIIMRDKIIELLQNRDKKMSQRIKDMLDLCNTSTEKKTLDDYCSILLNLEIMDDNWTKLLLSLKENYHNVCFDKFDEYTKGREHEYEQFAVYLIYRHFANSPDVFEAQKRARFVAFAYNFLYLATAVIYSYNGTLNFDTQIDIARQFSAEIEYSDDNLHTLFDIV